MTATTTDGTLDRAGAWVQRALARRVTRRSAVARIGRYGVALSLGAAGVELLNPPQAWANRLNCCGGCVGGCCGCESRWCDEGGNCPSGTCGCGYWLQGGQCIGSNGLKGTVAYGDCCGDCGDGSDCRCSSSFNCNGTCSSCQSCCNEFQWYESSHSCGSCGCPAWFIKCRRQFCQT